jgi:uncharacterized protein (UPF0261 family)
MSQPPEPTIALIGTGDTKAQEYTWIWRQLQRVGARVVTIDAGLDSVLAGTDFPPSSVAARAGVDLAELRAAGRGDTITAMAAGVRDIIVESIESETIDGVFAFGGSGGSALAAPALQAAPIGMPTVLVSTMASGDVGPYVGVCDVSITYSVVDIAGINPVNSVILDNAIVATVAMAARYRERRTEQAFDEMNAGTRTVAITMFGVTTPAADEARARLEELGYDVLVFHATGSGGRAMEKLIESGHIVGVCDMTTTELADELLGGVLSAGADRLLAAGAHAIPQVVSVGALDMVNFGSPETVPDRYRHRTLLAHNPSVTLMRTSASEMRELGAIVADKLNASRGPVAMFLPLGGISAVDLPGQPFHDPQADEELFSTLRARLDPTTVGLIESASAINDPGFGRAMADRLHAMIEGAS